VPTEIRSSLRFGGWYQLSEGAAGSEDVWERMRLIALRDWMRFEGRREVVVTATERGSGREAAVTLAPFVFRRP
jgi:hypothetical protein